MSYQKVSLRLAIILFALLAAGATASVARSALLDR